MSLRLPRNARAPEESVTRPRSGWRAFPALERSLASALVGTLLRWRPLPHKSRKAAAPASSPGRGSSSALSVALLLCCASACGKQRDIVEGYDGPALAVQRATPLL